MGRHSSHMTYIVGALIVQWLGIYFAGVISNAKVFTASLFNERGGPIFLFFFPSFPPSLINFVIRSFIQNTLDSNHYVMLFLHQLIVDEPACDHVIIMHWTPARAKEKTARADCQQSPTQQVRESVVRRLNAGHASVVTSLRRGLPATARIQTCIDTLFEQNLKSIDTQFHVSKSAASQHQPLLAIYQ